MSLIKKIEFNYHIKVINDLVQNKKYDDLNVELIKIYKKSKLLYFQILKKFYAPFQDLSNTKNIFYNNIVFVNSFISEDADIIYNFLSFYLNNVNYQKSYFSDISYEYAKIENLISNKNNISFDDIIENSCLYQSLISMDKSDYLNVFKNEYAFFSTSKDLNFSNPNIVKCYFLIVDHPYDVYKKIKESYGHDKFLSQNIMFNLDNSKNKKKYENIDIEIVKKGWDIHTSSWIDANVMNSFKGMIIKKDDLFNNCNELFSSIILHLRQSDIDIKLDYSLIEKYCSDLNYNIDATDNDISNNEKKFMYKQIKDIATELEFEL